MAPFNIIQAKAPADEIETYKSRTIPNDALEKPATAKLLT